MSDCIYLCTRFISLRIFAASAIMAIILLCPLVVSAQHQCGSHYSSWHQHPGDGYWTAQFKIHTWKPNVMWNEEEVLVTDSWKALIQRLGFKNGGCDDNTVTVNRTVTFTHSVSINWGGEISAGAEGAAKLWFWECQATVGAKVDWHRSGTSIKEEVFSVEQTRGIGRCKYIEFYYDVREVHKKFTANFADAEFQCKDHHTGNLSGWYLCNKRDVSCEGRGYILQRTGWENETRICDCGTDGIAFNHVEFDSEGRPVTDGSGAGATGNDQ